MHLIGSIYARHRDAGPLEGVGVCLPLVTERVEASGGDDGRRQPAVVGRQQG